MSRDLEELTDGLLLSDDQCSAIEALLTCPTIAAAAAQCGVPQRTLYRWRSVDADFQAALQRAQDQAIATAVGILKRRAADAAAQLAREMEAESPNKGRITACDRVLYYAFRAHEIETLQRRIEDLERQLGDGQ